MIHVEQLTKHYGDQVVVDQVSFKCRPGTVTGFLGPNGAGKSTTLRMMLGLTQPTAGGVTIGGLPYAAHPNPGRVVGAMLDASALHSGRTGIETLRLTARLLRLPPSRADEMLDRVGLGGVGKRRVGAYSLGMRQRLGIAAALMGDPLVLILDEPANGMDPDGIRWMRMLLRDFAGRGGTVLLSSHLLAEVQATVERLVMIRDGRIVADGALGELLTGNGTTVRGIDNDGLGDALRAAGFETRAGEGGRLHVQAAPEQVGRVAVAAQQILVELRDGGSAGLEDVYFHLTAGAAPDAAGSSVR